jgi:hypothetical protein
MPISDDEITPEQIVAFTKTNDEIAANLKVGNLVAFFHNDLPKRPGREYTEQYPPTKISLIVEIHDLSTLTLQPVEQAPDDDEVPVPFGGKYMHVPRFELSMKSRHNTWQPIV